MTQQCLDHNSPRERSYSVRSNAALGSPLPPITGGQFMRAEMPLLRHPTGEVNAQTQQCRNKSASPNDFNRSHHDIAEMLQVKRSTGKGQRTNAAMPKQKRPSRQLQGAIQKSQRCHDIPAPTEFGPFSSRRNATNNAPNNQRPLYIRRNAIHYTPRHLRKENKWTRDTKTQPSQRYSLHGAIARTWSEQRAS